LKEKNNERKNNEKENNEEKNNELPIPNLILDSEFSESDDEFFDCTKNKFVEKSMNKLDLNKKSK